MILEEIAMNDDDPSDTVHEAFAAQLFGDTPLGRPILGTVDSINAITRDQIAEHYAAQVHARNTWWWPPRAASTTTRSSSSTRAAFGRFLTGDAAPAPPAAGRRTAGRGRLGTGVRLVSRGDRAGEPGPRLRAACPGPTSAGSRSAC